MREVMTHCPTCNEMVPGAVFVDGKVGVDACGRCLVKMVGEMRAALQTIAEKAASHTVTHAQMKRGEADPGFAGIYEVAVRALGKKS